MTYTKAGPFVNGSSPFLNATFFNNVESRLAATGPDVVVAANGAPQSVKDGADFVCTGANDQVQIQAAIDLASPTVANNNTSPAGAAQYGRVSLSGGTFFISNPILMRTGVQLTGMGELTELKAIGISNTATGYPTGAASVIKMSAVTDHSMFVGDIWMNGNFASGGANCHGINWSGPGGSISGYPDRGSDPSNHIRNVFLSSFTTGTRHGIWLTNNLRAGHYSNIWVRDCTGNGFWADSTPDSYFMGGDFAGCGTGVRIEGANWRVSGVKDYYAGLNGGPGIGFYFGSGRHTVSCIESQDDPIGIQIAGIKNNFSSLTVDCASTDGIIVGASRNAINSASVYQRSGGRYTTTARGITFSAGVTDIIYTGFVEQTNGGTITAPVSGTLPSTRSFIRIADDSTGLRSVG